MTESSTLPDAGSSDLRAAADALRSRLPEPLGPLADIAYNYRWSWTPGGPELFASIDSRALGAVARQPGPTAAGGRTRTASRRWPTTSASSSGCDALERAVRTEGAPTDRPGRRDGPEPGRVLLRRVRDPRLAAGLLRRPRRARRRHPQGVLRPRRCRWSPSGSCTGTATSASASTAPAGSTSTGSTPTPTACPPRWSPATTASRSPSPCRSASRDVVAQVWRVDVGRVPLLLLDADRPENSVADRWITSRLYVGDPEVRLWQYALLGVGGVRALHALGVDPGVVHLNEGHAAFAGLELARARRPSSGVSRRGRARGRPRAHRLHHPHAGPGRQRHLPGRPDRRGARAAGRRPRRSTWRRSSAAAARTRTRPPSRSA